MPPESEVQQWLHLAQQDVSAARVLLASEPALLESGCFHCQQAVEKAIKGFLCWRSIPFPRVHTLGLLFDLGQQQDASFHDIRDQCEWLTRFAVQDRYPHGRKISREKAQEALAAAETACRFVLERLPDEVHP